MPGFHRQYVPRGGAMGQYRDNTGPLVPLMLYLEQAQVYNSYNTTVCNFVYENTTTNGIGISTLWCPSDGSIVGLRYVYPAGSGWDCSVLPMTYSSYAGCMGTWDTFPGGSNPFFRSLIANMNGIFYYIGYPNWLSNPNGFPTNPGSIPPTKLADITDGTSNTIVFGERAHGLFSKQAGPDGNTDFYEWNWWTSGNYGDTIFTTLYPMNPQKKIGNGNDTTGNVSQQADNFAISASSFHPGGANFAFCDGSVKFLKDSINCWPYNPANGYPTNILNNATTGAPYIAPGTQGVYQALSTRSGGEVVSSDAY
jgi:prepilin-type processing-associated H-X9-DG protein